MKKVLMSAALAAFMLAPSLVCAEYFAAKDAEKYHHADCHWVKKIRPENLASFKTTEEARQAGYEPCRVCNPAAAAQEDRAVRGRPAQSGR